MTELTKSVYIGQQFSKDPKIIAGLCQHIWSAISCMFGLPENLSSSWKKMETRLTVHFNSVMQFLYISLITLFSFSYKKVTFLENISQK